jgi:hypothetical protein
MDKILVKEVEFMWKKLLEKRAKTGKAWASAAWASAQ